MSVSFNDMIKNKTLDSYTKKEEDIFYEEGDKCPKCKNGILVNRQETDTGWVYLECQGCKYDATEDVKEVKTK